MNRILLTCGLVAAAALAGCMTSAPVKQAQDTCVALGAPQGTENHAECRSRVAAVQQQAQEAKPPPGPEPQNPSPASPAKRP
jgi:hypothetical protein